MNWLDIIVSLLLLAAFLRGIKKGLVMQLAGFATIIIGAIFAGKVGKMILPFLLDTINISLNVAVVISYVLAFIAIGLIISIVGKMIQGLFEALYLSFINKILGALVGIATTMIVLSIILNLAILIDPEEEVITNNLKNESFFYPKVQMLVPIIVPYLNIDLWQNHIPEKYRPNYEEEEGDVYPPKELQT